METHSSILPTWNPWTGRLAGTGRSSRVAKSELWWHSFRLEEVCCSPHLWLRSSSNIFWFKDNFMQSSYESEAEGTSLRLGLLQLREYGPPRISLKCSFCFRGQRRWVSSNKFYRWCSWCWNLIFEQGPRECWRDYLVSVGCGSDWLKSSAPSLRVSNSWMSFSGVGVLTSLLVPQLPLFCVGTGNRQKASLRINWVHPPPWPSYVVTIALLFCLHNKVGLCINLERLYLCGSRGGGMVNCFFEISQFWYKLNWRSYISQKVLNFKSRETREKRKRE